ncbi:MAG: carbohydrate kinase [Sulfurovum sp. FS08-3]|nr:MAG: carbohydrate kinase [Sulfurovum sp. FS08-3]
MQKVYHEVNQLDRHCYEAFGLSEDILMENAARAISDAIVQNFSPNKKVLIVSGVGNNGADGIVVARHLHGDYNVSLYLPFGAKSPMCVLQLQRAKQLGISIVEKIEDGYDIVIDALFGTGLNKPLNSRAVEVIEQMNALSGFKIACDIASGIDSEGEVEGVAFEAHTTITMGALKKSLFSDKAKEYVGEIEVAHLGVTRRLYEAYDTSIFLLEKSDMRLPHRHKANTHKGNYGHVHVIVGEQEGAGIMAAMSAFRFGSGLVTAVSPSKPANLPLYLMHSRSIGSHCSALALGMGLGDFDLSKILELDIPMVVDADMFYKDEIKQLLNKEQIVLTPHPKEFVSLLKLCNIADISVGELQSSRFKYLELFSTQYPNIVLLLKGANVLIAHQEKIYINTLGSATLAKGGSGDVLAGLIASLLAQNYSPLDATISASLAHTMASRQYTKNSYAMTPLELIETIALLKV